MKYLITLLLVISLNALALDCSTVKYDRKAFSFKSGVVNCDLRVRAGGTCKIKWGDRVADDYTGVMEDVYSMQADHIIPLKWAWVMGACEWTKAERKAFAYDFDNLALTHKYHNTSKGSKGIDAWTPIGTEYDYTYRILWNKAVSKYFQFIL